MCTHIHTYRHLMNTMNLPPAEETFRYCHSGLWRQLCCFYTVFNEIREMKLKQIFKQINSNFTVRSLT